MQASDNRNKTLSEYAKAAILFADLVNDDACNPTNFLLFKLLSDISEKLDSINRNIEHIRINGADTTK